MSLRVQTIAAYYPEYLKQFYDQRPELATQSYAAQHAALMANTLRAPDLRSVAFSQLGFETSHIFGNAEHMQKRWALENGITYDEAHWLLEITAAQIKAFRPEILFASNHRTFTADFLQNMKSACPSIRLVIGWRGEGLVPDVSHFREHDVILCCSPERVQYFRENGLCCYHLNHAFDPHILERIDTKQAANTDFTFIGSIGGSHYDREQLLLKLKQKTNLQLWLRILQPTRKKTIRTMIRRMVYDTLRPESRIGFLPGLLEKVPLVRRVARSESHQLSRSPHSQIIGHAHPPLFGLAMFQQLYNSKVALNVHGNTSEDSASNMRLYEATGVGTCLLTDWKANISDLFEPDAEIVTYRSAAECIEKSHYLLAHDDERRAIAAAGQRRTMRDHTIQQRAEQIADIIRSHLRSLQS